MESLNLTRPDDWHVHLRDGDKLATTVAHTATRFKRAIIMPNLDTPVTTTEMALAYRERILAAVPAGIDFDPLMTLYLTNSISPNEVAKAAESDHIYAAKLYPAGATTNADMGVTAIDNIHPVLEEMEKLDFPLLVHGEAVDLDIDIFDREKVFIDKHLAPLIKNFPKLRIVFEHISTQYAVNIVMDMPDTIAATITAHHLFLNRNALFAGGIKPHYYCLPKRVIRVDAIKGKRLFIKVCPFKWLHMTGMSLCRM